MMIRRARAWAEEELCWLKSFVSKRIFLANSIIDDPLAGSRDMILVFVSCELDLSSSSSTSSLSKMSLGVVREVSESVT